MEKYKFTFSISACILLASVLLTSSVTNAEPYTVAHGMTAFEKTNAKNVKKKHALTCENADTVGLLSEASQVIISGAYKIDTGKYGLPKFRATLAAANTWCWYEPRTNIVYHKNYLNKGYVMIPVKHTITDDSAKDILHNCTIPSGMVFGMVIQGATRNCRIFIKTNPSYK